MLSFAFSFMAGILTAVSPCVLPALPLIVGSAAQEHRHAPLAVAAGMITAFTFFGVLLAAFGSGLGLDGEVFRWIGATLMIFFGLSLLVPRINEWLQARLTPLADLGNKALLQRKFGGWGGQFALGALLGLVWSPCTGPTLGAAIGLASQGGLVHSTGMMLLFGIGAALPLLLIAYGAKATFLRRRASLVRAGSKAKPIFGALILLIGIGVLTGADKFAEAKLTQLMPEAWVDLVTRY